MKYRDQRVVSAAREEDFTCQFCGAAVSSEAAGSLHRNHCPRCLASIHLDDKPGDRASDCHGRMDAMAVWVRQNGEWAVIHRCRTCGVLHSNRIAADDNSLLLLSIAVKPLAEPPFPLGLLERSMAQESGVQSE
ncbi:MAG: RNHCP domain-containing protein [Oscillospiraceae bacterium]|nr:RNHCP domain-containing protein [Oscillospiraceae bacterium]